MHRTIQIFLSSADSQKSCDELTALETVVDVSLSKGISIKPPGDVITVDALTRGADDALNRIRAFSEKHDVSVATTKAASFIDPKNSEKIQDDADEAIWEEMETGLRHQGRITLNFVFLMALGGAICTVVSALTFCLSSRRERLFFGSNRFLFTSANRSFDF